MNEIMNYLLEWTVKQTSGAPDALCPEHVCSPEVYDRAVSVIGIVVPLTVWLFAVAMVLLLFVCFCKFLRGGK